jgi:hypothetical protein
MRSLRSQPQKCWGFAPFAAFPKRSRCVPASDRARCGQRVASRAPEIAAAAPRLRQPQCINEPGQFDRSGSNGTRGVQGCSLRLLTGVIPIAHPVLCAVYRDALGRQGTAGNRTFPPSLPNAKVRPNADPHRGPHFGRVMPRSCHHGWEDRNTRGNPLGRRPRRDVWGPIRVTHLGPRSTWPHIGPDIMTAIDHVSLSPNAVLSSAA